MPSESPDIKTLIDAIREMVKDGTVRTHSEKCWEWHLPCAALFAADLLEGYREQLGHLAHWMDVIATFGAERPVSSEELKEWITGDERPPREKDYEQAFGMVQFLASECLNPELKALAEDVHMTDIREVARQIRKQEGK